MFLISPAAENSQLLMLKVCTAPLMCCRFQCAQPSEELKMSKVRIYQFEVIYQSQRTKCRVRIEAQVCLIPQLLI